MNCITLLRISRPRFWLYEAATFALIGAVAGAADTAFLSDWRFWTFTLYFLIPANLLIYGVNDIYDYETDRLNPKKGLYEVLVHPDMHSTLWKWIIFTTLPFLFFIPSSFPLIASFAAFLFFALMYSAKPIRAKAIPILDSLFSAGHYVATGVFGYYLAGGTVFPWIGVIAGMSWAIAMHAVSAVPDIEADTRAGLSTIATLLGKRGTLSLCVILYGVAAVITRDILPLASMVGGFAFIYAMHRMFRARTQAALFREYTYFPLLNTTVGALVSITLMLSLFS
ncbi:MAG TPA: prenyltransferase [Candidatus Paceibacterota bacterium]